MYTIILGLIYLLTCVLSDNVKRKISDINVLLPICDDKGCNKVYYSIFAYGGCYEW